MFRERTPVSAQGFKMGHTADQANQRFIPAPAFDFKDPVSHIPVQGISPDPIICIGWINGYAALL